MSGGAHGYLYMRVEEMALDERVRLGSPLRRAFAVHLQLIAKAMRAIEWNDSADGDDQEDEYLQAIITPAVQLSVMIDQAHAARADLLAAIDRAETERRKE